MTKEKFKKILDFVPLSILVGSGLIMIWKVHANDTFYTWRQIVGLILLLIVILLFVKKHKLGVIALGATILIGMFGLMSLSYVTYTITLYLGNSDERIPYFYGQPLFILWFIIYFIVSTRHFYLIHTRQYWKELFASAKRLTDYSISAFVILSIFCNLAE